MAAAPILTRNRAVALGEGDLRARIGRWSDPALLGGDRRSGLAGRWSILAAHPRRTFEAATGRPALPGLAALLAETLRPDAETEGLDQSLPFLGGWIGFLAYDLAPEIEAVPRRCAAGSGWPAARFGFYDTFVLVDHTSEQATLWAVDLLGEGERALAARLDDWTTRLAKPPTPAPALPPLGPVVAEQTRSAYLARVEQARRYIHAGDIFQVNLTQRFSAAGRVDPLDLDRRLRAASPAPYAAYLQWGDRALSSASPELFYETTGRRIVTRPIKGTRPRSLNPDLDAALAAELWASAKDEAELTMIVDLERNDLGRVCDFHSVRVLDPRSVASYQNVHHTVATIAGHLRPTAGPIDVVRALFPGGSITGAPKIRAMEIIDELEPAPRGVYTGAIGYWSIHGRSAFNIAIRTLVVDGHGVSYHVGGGIVVDSDPAAEYQETLDKGRNLFATLARLGGES